MERVGMDFLWQWIGQKKPRTRRKQKWKPSPWNKEKIPKEKPVPIMMCKRCKHPR